MRTNVFKNNLTLLVLFIAVVTLSSFTQSDESWQSQRRGKERSCMNLSDDQQEQMRKLRVEFLKETQEERNELAELKVQQRTLLTATTPDRKAIFSNANRIAEKREAIAKQRVEMQLAVHNLLTEEQRLQRSSRMSGDFGVRGQGRMGQGKARGHRMKSACGARCDGTGKGIGRNQNAGKGMMGMLSLSDEQKEKMEDLRLAHLKETQGLKNQLQELKVKQHNLMWTAQPNKKDLLANVERIGDIKTQLMKKKLNHQLEMKKLLSDEQKVLWNARGNKRFGRHGQHHFRGVNW